MNEQLWNIESWLESAQVWLSKLYGLPGGVLVLVSCIAFGYLLKLVPAKWFPNAGIPVAVILWGCAFNMLMADPRADALPIRVWIGKNFLIGLIIGVIAWMIHNKIIKRFTKDNDLADGKPLINNET